MSRIAQRKMCKGMGEESREGEMREMHKSRTMQGKVGEKTEMTCNPELEDEKKSDDDIENVNNNYPEKFNKNWSLHTQRAKPNGIAVIARERGITLFCLHLRSHHELPYLNITIVHKLSPIVL